MKKILFVCLGNICRSVMAEYIMKDILDKNNEAEDYYVDSCAVSREEIGNSIYPPARRKLESENVPIGNHRARQFCIEDYEKFDYIIGMDDSNMYRLNNMTSGDPLNKCYKLLSFAGSNRDVSDPWWTDDFDTAYNDITLGVNALLEYFKNKS